jgi:DNA repair protein RadC
MTQLILFPKIVDQARLPYLPDSEQPFRRVAEHPAACNLVELLAALIGGPRQIETAERLLGYFKSLTAIRQARAEEIAKGVPGIGMSTAVRLVAALELGQRLATETPEERPTIHSPGDLAALIQYEMSTFEQEHLRVILLNTRNGLIGWEDIYRGSLNASQVRIGELFRAAIRRNAAAIILTHNHPSGDPSPSSDDVAVTRAVVQAGKLMDINVLDHLIIGQGGRYVSMKERGLGFSP